MKSRIRNCFTKHVGPDVFDSQFEGLLDFRVLHGRIANKTKRLVSNWVNTCKCILSIHFTPSAPLTYTLKVIELSEIFKMLMDN